MAINIAILCVQNHLTKLCDRCIILGRIVPIRDGQIPAVVPKKESAQWTDKRNFTSMPFILINGGSEREPVETKPSVRLTIVPSREEVEEMKRLRFLLPETLKVYEAEYARLEAEAKDASARYWSVESSSNSDRIVRDLSDRLYELDETLRKAERIQILSESVEICRQTVAVDANNQPVEYRLVVKWGEKIFLAHVISQFSGRPVCDWMTDSVGQFNRRELEAVKAFQSAIKKEVEVPKKKNWLRWLFAK